MTSLASALNSSALALFGLGGAYNSSGAYNHSQPVSGVVLNYTGPIVDLFNPTDEYNHNLMDRYASIKEAVESDNPLPEAAVLDAAEDAVDAEEGIAQAAPAAEKQSAKQMSRAKLLASQALEALSRLWERCAGSELCKLSEWDAEDLNNLEYYDLQKLKVDEINRLPIGELEKLDPKVLNSLKESEMEKLLPHVLKGLSREALGKLSILLIRSLPDFTFDNLSDYVRENLPEHTKKAADEREKDPDANVRWMKGHYRSKYNKGIALKLDGEIDLPLSVRDLPAVSIPVFADDKHRAAPSVAKPASAAISVSKRTAEELSSLSDSADATTLTRLRVAVLREKYPPLAAAADSGYSGDYDPAQWAAMKRSGFSGLGDVHQYYRSRSIPAAFASRIAEPVFPYGPIPKKRSVEKLNSLPLFESVTAGELNRLSDKDLLKLGPVAIDRVYDFENLELHVLTGVSPVTLEKLLPTTIYGLPPDLYYGLVDYIRENA